jgi:hypothetical protein
VIGLGLLAAGLWMAFVFDIQNIPDHGDDPVTRAMLVQTYNAICGCVVAVGGIIILALIPLLTPRHGAKP